jgi:beta-glucanase (GH16 family)
MSVGLKGGSVAYRAGSGVHSKGWSLVWSDEFNGTGALSSTDWDYEVGAIRNNEDQYYQAGTLNANQNGGNLEIEARQESVGGKSYTSASVITLDWNTGDPKRSFLYGALEVSAKIPSFTGSWCAIWMTGISGSWPARGEIDIMEHVGYDPTNVHIGNIHTTNNQNTNSPPYFNTTGSFDASVSHVYRMEWFATKIDFFMDGSLISTYTNPGTGPDDWPFSQPMFLLMNFAIGGTWGGSGGATNNSALPAKMLIDYVRYYKKV